MGGTAPPWLFTSNDGARNWGWHGLVLPLARILVRADAIWSGLELAHRALGLVRRAESRPLEIPWHTHQAIEGLRDVHTSLTARYRERRDELARALAAACRAPEAPVRAPLAALWWTLGDPWRAHVLASGGPAPSRRRLREVLDAAVRRAPRDPMLTSVGSRLWTAPGLDGEPSDPMRIRLSVRWLGSRGATVVEGLQQAAGVSPSEVYGRALHGWFGGLLDDGDRAAVARLAPLVAEALPEAGIRFRALDLVMSGAADSAAWGRLADQAAAIVAEERWEATDDPYDRSIDLPSYYYDAGDEQRLALIERQRRATLEFSMWHTRPGRAPTAPASLLDEEERILEDVRGLRFVMELARLPVHVAQAWIVAPAKPGRWADPDRALTALGAHRRRLAELAVEQEDLDPGFGGARCAPPATLSEFAATLQDQARADQRRHR